MVVESSGGAIDLRTKTILSRVEAVTQPLAR